MTVLFWHAFGPHKNEKPQAIIHRKCQEIVNNGGWTLWSFRYLRLAGIETWITQLGNKDAEDVYVLCSNNENNIDPAGKCSNNKNKIDQIVAKFYKEYLNNQWQEWQNVPDTIQIPHPWGAHGPAATKASAFKVSEILSITGNDDVKRFIPNWNNLQKFERFRLSDQQWRPTPYYPCRNFLIRPTNEQGFALANYNWVLKLKYPYVVQISLNNHSNHGMKTKCRK